MKKHLTDSDMAHYVEIATLTPENVAFIGQVNMHVFACEECKRKLNDYCMQAEIQSVSNNENNAMYKDVRRR